MNFRRFAFLAIYFLLCNPIQAEDRYWVGESGSWDDPYNWSLTAGSPGGAGKPLNGYAVFLVQSDGINRTITYNTFAPDSYWFTSLEVDATGSGATTLSIQQTLDVSKQLIGHYGNGTLKLSEGTNSAFSLVLGYWGTANGTFDMTGGNLLSYGEVIGSLGTGTFNQTGGSNILNGTALSGYGIVSIGSSEGSSGTYNLGGTGSLEARGISVRYGVFNHSAGTSATQFLTLGNPGSNPSTYNLSGEASLTVSNNQYVGSGGGSGVFNQTGGVNTVRGTTSSALYLGMDAGSNGVYNLSGNGSLVANSEHIGEYGVGTFNQTDGSNSSDAGIWIGARNGSSGTYNLSKGELTSPYEAIGFVGTGVFNQYGGSNSVAGRLDIGISSGTYNMYGGTLTAVNTVVHPGGTFNIIGGDVFTPLTNNGFVAGSGELTGDFVNFGALAPGLSPGILTIDGNFTQDFLGILQVELAGYTKGAEYDFLSITGAARLNGTLDVDLLSFFDPSPGSVFNILHAEGGILDTRFALFAFPTLSGGKYWDIGYGTKDVFIYVQGGTEPVPEPSTMLLLGSGLAGLVGYGKRRMKK
ncbi:MAG: PEP-CTERM sorting domain-containing protein [Deltaproteobacteria bacterium]